MTATVDVLIPTRNRPAALAVTLTALMGRRFDGSNIVAMEQSDGPAGYDSGGRRANLPHWPTDDAGHAACGNRSS